MKICTITCHNVYNYGASLQAYALQHYLESIGHDVKIIDFIPYHQNYRYNLFYISKQSRYYLLCQHYPILRFPIGFYRNRKMFITIGRKRRFNKFTKEYLHLTNNHYTSSEELKNNPPNADAYIAGSDQIWNTENGNGQEPAYFADFGDSHTRRFSYAASFGVNKIKDELKAFVTSEVRKFNKVSVRERSAVEMLHELGIDDVVQVLDPVFLLTKEEWNFLADGAKRYCYKPMKYVLVYDFFGDSRIQNMAESIKKENLGLQIVSVNDSRGNKYADVNIYDAGPLEFLNLIRYAHTVLACSFHAAAFSVIFNKDFYIYPLKGYNNSSRMEDFLSLLGIINRYNCSTIQDIIDYHRVETRLKPILSESKQFLNNLEAINIL